MPVRIFEESHPKIVVVHLRDQVSGVREGDPALRERRDRSKAISAQRK
jgi:hypothetical protein